MIKKFEDFLKPLNEGKTIEITHEDYMAALLDLTSECIDATIENLHKLGGKIEFPEPINLEMYDRYKTNKSFQEIIAVEVGDDDTEGVAEILKNQLNYSSIRGNIAFTNGADEVIIITNTNGEKAIVDAGDGFPVFAYFEIYNAVTDELNKLN